MYKLFEKEIQKYNTYFILYIRLIDNSIETLFKRGEVKLMDL